MKEHRSVRYFGDVQGVGFRYTAIREAEPYDLEGYVRNMPDGSVEIVVEGERTDIDAFLDSLNFRMTANIRSKTEGISAFTGMLGPFGIKR